MLEDLLAILHPPKLIHERVIQSSDRRTILSIQFSMLEHTLSRQASIGINGEVLENFLRRLGPRDIHGPDKDDSPQAGGEWARLGGGNLLSVNKSQGLYRHVRTTDVAVHSSVWGLLRCIRYQVAPQSKH